MISLGPDETLHLAHLDVMCQHLKMFAENASPLPSEVVPLFAGWLEDLLDELHNGRSNVT